MTQQQTHVNVALWTCWSGCTDPEVKSALNDLARSGRAGAADVRALADKHGETYPALRELADILEGDQWT